LKYIVIIAHSELTHCVGREGLDWEPGVRMTLLNWYCPAVDQLWQDDAELIINRQSFFVSEWGSKKNLTIPYRLKSAVMFKFQL
jgi:hypothetical protein